MHYVLHPTPFQHNDKPVLVYNASRKYKKFSYIRITMYCNVHVVHNYYYTMCMYTSWLLYYA